MAVSSHQKLSSLSSVVAVPFVELAVGAARQRLGRWPVGPSGELERLRPGLRHAGNVVPRNQQMTYLRPRGTCWTL